MSDIKPCPFCGSPADEYYVNKESLYYCRNENCFLFDIDQPENIWNTRPIEDALQKELEETDNSNWELRRKLEIAAKRMRALVEYRRCISPLNFQLEKLDDYIGDIEIALEAIEKV